MAESKDPEKLPEQTRKVFWSQWVAALTVSLAAFVSGLANGWASPYLAQLTSNATETTLNLTDNEASWVASLLNLGRFLGAVVGAVCQEYTGRKMTLLLGSLPLASSWVLNGYSNTVTMLYVSRLLSGVGSGMIWPAISLFLGEVADPMIRGALITMNVNVSFIGAFLGNVMGPYLSMEMFAYVSLVPNVLFVALFSLVPESPYHYILHGDIDSAETSLKWFRRQDDIKKEMRELQDFVDVKGNNIFEALKELRHARNQKNMFIMFCLNVMVYMTGYTVINSYTEIIIANAEVSLTPSTVVMALGFSTILSGSMAIFLIDRLGRRRLLMIAGTGVTISACALGLHFHLLSLGLDPHNLTWLPITSLLFFSLFISCGILPLPSTLLGEMFPACLKSSASLFLSAANALLAFAFTKTYQPYLNLVGQKWVFWTYGISTIFLVPFTYFCIPETKGKSLLEIQKSMKP